MSKFVLDTPYGTRLYVYVLGIHTVVEEIGTVYYDCNARVYKTFKGALKRINRLTGQEFTWKSIQEYRVE